MLAEEILGFIQKLVHAPDKIGKAVIAIAKAALCMVAASKLFLYLIGPYQLIELSSYPNWEEFVTSGRILICLLLFSAAYFVLFEVFGLITSLILSGLQAISKPTRLSPVERKYMGFLFNKLKLLKIDLDKKQVTAAEHTDDFYEAVIYINSKEGKSEFANLQNSFASKIWHTYIVFIVYYYWFYTGPTNALLSTMIIAGAILLTFFYLGVNFILRFLQHNPDRLIRDLEAVRGRTIAEKTFADLGIITYRTDKPEKQDVDTCFEFKNKTYRVVYHFKGRNQFLTEFTINRLKEQIERTNEPIFLLTNLRLTQNTQDMANQLANRFVVISFSDETDLIAQFKNFFYPPLLKESL